MPNLESAFKTRVLKDLREYVLPGCITLSIPMQGLPDTQVLFQRRWGFLEFKRSIREPYQPNQEYYIDLFNEMSFAAMICPENEVEVLRALEHALRS